MTTINRVLVANRGEIARRVFATCRRLGIETVAVHSDADAGLPFVAEADVAVRLPGNTPAETYLRGDLVIEAAQRAGADAIHPGYGFLSENAEFARAVTDAGLTWIGPSPDAIERMGSKIESKKLMETAGVPVLGNLTADTATEADLPLLVKASAGGGGRGMRIVRSLDALADEIARASAEAESAFGDGTVFVEPYVEQGRHVEVQVVGWSNEGATDAVVFGTRDCSLQRRHQKVVEEAPAPGLSDSTREAIHEAARAAATSVGYVGAGTVEFLFDPVKESFYFLEMNTRLQVEHPVTELIYGVDLVALQIAVAEGQPVVNLSEDHGPRSASQPVGHAIEVRLYAEDPSHDYAPQTGRLLELDLAHDSTFELSGYGIRLDSGFETGNEVGTFYDAMLAKVIAYAPTREQAARALARTLETARVHGLVTNRDQLVASLRHPRFLAAELTTSFYDDHPQLTQRAPGDDLLPFAGAVALAEHRRTNARVQAHLPAGFRNVVAQPQSTRFDLDGTEVDVRWYGGRTGYSPADQDEDRPVAVLSASPDDVVLDVAGVSRRYRTRVVEGAVLVDGPRGGATLRVVPRFVDPADKVAEGSLLAPMPGSIIAVRAAVGEEVSEGQPILVMEAMKMQHTIAAPYAGTVTEIAASAGDQVDAGAVLAVVATGDPTDSDTEPGEDA